MIERYDVPAVPIDLAVDPDNLLLSVTNGILSVPDGVSYFEFDNQANRLRQFFSFDSKDQSWPPSRIGIVKMNDLQTGGTAIKIARFFGPDLEITSNVLYFNTDHQGAIKDVSFSYSPSFGPRLHAYLKPDENGVLGSRASVYMPLIPGVASFNLAYADTGDCRTLTFESLAGCSPEQLNLVFQDGNVPDIDLQGVIYETIFSDDFERVEFDLPQLRFDPARYDFHPKYDDRTTYLARSESPPVIEQGEVISGVSLSKEGKSNQPFSVRVKLKEIEEIEYHYAYTEERTAVEIRGEVIIDDGQKEQIFSNQEFIVLAGLDYLKSHPQLIPGGVSGLYSPRR